MGLGPSDWCGSLVHEKHHQTQPFVLLFFSPVCKLCKRSGPRDEAEGLGFVQGLCTATWALLWPAAWASAISRLHVTRTVYNQFEGRNKHILGQPKKAQ
jgi:hypothetical protein